MFATGYAEGGGQEWGGRFYFPLLVPMAVLAVVWLVRAAEGWTAADRRALLAPLVAMAVVPSLLGLVVVRDLRHVGQARRQVVVEYLPVAERLLVVTVGHDRGPFPLARACGRQHGSPVGSLGAMV